MLKIRKPSALVAMCAGRNHPILATSPELVFMNAVCRGDIDGALSLFQDKKLFGGVPSAVDAPYGRFEGLAGIREFAENFLKVFGADRAALVPVVQTRANGRSVTEVQIDLEIDGEIEQVPMFVVGELRTQSTLDEVRLYCHHTYVPGLQAYRKPIFKSAHLEMGDPNLLTGAMREYYEGLHHVPAADVDRIVNAIEPGCRFGGYHPNDFTSVEISEEDHLRIFRGMEAYIPRCVGMRYETITDDGVTCVIEWQHIVSKAGQEERNRIAIAGISAYERGDSGKLCGIRISDYAGYESTIDWTKTPVTKEEAQAINYVDVFPAGVGRNAQSEFHGE